MIRQEPIAPKRSGLTALQIDYTHLARRIKHWGRALGFRQIGIADIDLAAAEAHLTRWLKDGFHGTMTYMHRHGHARTRPAALVPGTLRVVSARLDYLPQNHDSMQAILDDPAKGYLSRYALGRDYHKIVRRRLQKLADRIEQAVGPFGYRAFCDSAPVMEKALAEKAGIGWIGKHSNLIGKASGSWFFLGELYTDLPLPVDTPATNHCGRCRACIDICPTQAIVAPYRVDARRCISYLTIELHGPIPEPLRPMMGNRIYGCDDCQLVCPWNRFARLADSADFQPRHRLESSDLIDLFAWNQARFLKNTEGSPIRRIGHDRWLRNIAVALGNAPSTADVIAALAVRRQHPSELVREHVEWALRQHETRIQTRHPHRSGTTIVR